MNEPHLFPARWGISFRAKPHQQNPFVFCLAKNLSEDKQTSTERGSKSPPMMISSVKKHQPAWLTKKNPRDTINNPTGTIGRGPLLTTVFSSTFTMERRKHTAKRISGLQKERV